jgi:hypothetical protein
MLGGSFVFTPQDVDDLADSLDAGETDGDDDSCPLPDEDEDADGTDDDLDCPFEG